MREIKTENGSVMYLNSGDWIENLSALEYVDGEWSVYQYALDPIASKYKLHRDNERSLDTNLIFQKMVTEFSLRAKA